MYQYILFDLDGTLTDPEEGITKSVQYALKKYNIEVEDRKQLLKFIGPPLQFSFMEFYGFDKKKALEAVGKYRERYAAKGLFENRVFPGVKELLEVLVKQGKTLAIATSKPEVFAKKIADKYELTPYFKVITGCEPDETRSIKAEVIEETLKRLGLDEKDKDKVVMVGDRKHDIIGAKTCKLASVGVRFGYAEEGELEAAGADEIADTIQDLQEILLRK